MRLRTSTALLSAIGGPTGPVEPGSFAAAQGKLPRCNGAALGRGAGVTARWVSSYTRLNSVQTDLGILPLAEDVGGVSGAFLWQDEAP